MFVIKKQKGNIMTYTTSAATNGTNVYGSTGDNVVVSTPIADEFIDGSDDVCTVPDSISADDMNDFAKGLIGAIYEITGENQPKNKNKDLEKFHKFIHIIFALCDLCDYHLEERMVIKDMKTKKIYR